jgi:hypothetical protein
MLRTFLGSLNLGDDIIKIRYVGPRSGSDLNVRRRTGVTKPGIVR